MNKLLQRLKKAYHLDTDAEVAKFLEIKPSTLSMQKNRGNYDLSRIIDKCSDLNMNWLLYGEGPMRYQENSLYDNSANIPIYTDVNQIKNEDSTQMRKELFRILLDGGSAAFLDNNSSPSGMKGFTINSDAMYPTLKKKDVAIIDTGYDHVVNEAIFLFSYQNSVMYRRIQLTPDGDYSVCSDNDTHETFKVPCEDEKLNIIGKVIMILRKI